MTTMTHADLAARLLDAVRAQRFESTADAMLGGAPLRAFPSLDLALIAFPHDAAPVFANVLFSREHPQGLVAETGAEAGSVRNLRFDADRRDAEGVSEAWLPGADWSRLRFEALAGAGPRRFVAPYPASLIKLMVAVGVARAVDAGACTWERSTLRACEQMLTVSSNEATTAMVALLHRHGGIDGLHQAFASRGLHTLRLDGTRADGGWTNAAGAGVGRLQMTAWDSARLLWLLDAGAPPAPWLAPGTPALLSQAGRDRLRGWLEAQALHGVLSSAAPAGVRFAHKTGTTENYASDAGIVTGLPPARRHYIVALISNLGRRCAPHPSCATTSRLPALGRAIDDMMAALLEEPRG